MGLKLWEQAQELMDSSLLTIVQVATYNKKAIKFYEKLGFKDNGNRHENEKTRMKSGAIIPEMEMELKEIRGSSRSQG